MLDLKRGRRAAQEGPMRNGTTAMRAIGPGILLCLAAAASGAAHADLLSAQQSFKQGDYEKAFNEYRDLAQLGQPTAQYNLAVMYARGLGIQQSDLNAYAWASLAGDNGDSNGKRLAEKLRQDLVPGTEKIAEDVRRQYGQQALDERLMPKIERDPLPDKPENSRCRSVHTEFPTYPASALDNGKEGIVYAEFSVHADGSARNPRIIYALPAGLFEAAVRDSLLHTRYPKGSADALPVHCGAIYDFFNRTIQGDALQLKYVLSKARISAEAGDPSSELLYGMLLAGLGDQKTSRSDALPWFLKAAQAGSPVGQYQVGYGLLKGWGCHCDENKGAEWLRRAAQQDQPDAQVALAEYSLRGKPDEESVKRAKMWLERAAASGSWDGKLYLAALLAAAPYSDVRDASAASWLIDEVFAGVKDDPTASEIRAAAAANSGDFDKAVKVENKALDQAWHLAWDLTPLRERLAHYRAHQPWYGDLLGF